ncbi:uncharacterized protein [Oryza sativa Japonica Group]|uniref:uncharacterized protein isoform X2 n=1 Tax=Oryza sativa subsp. japonica TaxID=39947 RepID=UPI00339C1E90
MPPRRPAPRRGSAASPRCGRSAAAVSTSSTTPIPAGQGFWRMPAGTTTNSAPFSIQERVRKKGRAQFNKSKTGSIVAFKVSFRDFNPLNSFIWFELFGEPTDRDVDLLGGVIQAWYVMGRLGAYNSSNLQLANSMLDYDPSYDSDQASGVMPSSFHDISDVEFQDNWGRVWVDLGTSDYLGLDVLLNCLTQLSSEHLGIKQVVFGGKKMGDWEEGMKNSDYGYRHFKI